MPLSNVSPEEAFDFPRPTIEEFNRLIEKIERTLYPNSRFAQSQSPEDKLISNDLETTLPSLQIVEIA